MDLLSEEIKKMLFTGKAAFKTYVIGMTGSSLIPIAQQCVGIVVSLKYYSFLDIPEADFRNDVVPFSAIYDRSVTQINLLSPKSKNSFIVRDKITCAQVFDSAAGANVNQWQINGEANFECFLVHENSIQVEIVKTPAAANQGTLFTDFTPDSINKPQPPEGYGVDGQPGSIVQPVQVGVDVAGNYTTVPLSADQVGNPVAAANLTGQLKFPVNAGTALQPFDSAGAYKTRAYPIVNFGVIEIRKNIYSQFLSSN